MQLTSITTASSPHDSEIQAPNAGEVTKDAANVAETNPYAAERSVFSVTSATYASITLNVTENNPLIENRAKYHLKFQTGIISLNSKNSNY